MSSGLIFDGTKKLKSQIKSRILKIILNQIKSRKGDFKLLNQIIKSNILIPWYCFLKRCTVQFLALAASDIKKGIIF
jgi:hypothetical protein